MPENIAQATMNIYQMVGRILYLVLLGYVALCVLVFVFQRKMLYLPSGGRISAERAGYQGLLHWPDYENFRGFVNQADLVDPRGTIIVFHGNAGAAYHRGFYTDALTAQNMRVVLAEYPGYGGRAGRPNEAALVNDALETISLAYEKFGGPIFLWGESLGCGVVSAAIVQTDVPIAGLILLLPWDTLPDLARTHYWYLPARWFVLDKYDNIKNLRGYDGKIAVLLAENDEVVPVKHGNRLYDSLTAEKKQWLFEDVSHNEFPVRADRPWWREVVEFVSR